MGYLAWLEKGQSKLRLDGSEGYRLALDFAPPSTSEDVLTAGGSMLNRRGGARLVDVKAVNQNFGFGVHVEGSSSAEIQERVDTLDAFLRSGDTLREPVKLAYRPDDNFAQEPLFGQLGATRRLTIVRGAAAMSPVYGIRTMRANRLPNCRVGMEILPFAEGIYQQSGWAQGGVLEDWIGTVDQRSRGTMIPEATTNLYTNPIYGNATYDTNWSQSSASLLDEQNNLGDYLLFGKNSVKLINTDTVNGHSWGETLTPAAATTYACSYYAKRPDGGAVTATETNVWAIAANQTCTYTAVGNGWYRVWCTFTGDGVARITGVRVKAGQTIYVDGFQLEAKGYITSLAYGDLPGCAWSGTAHASTTTRGAGILRLPSAGKVSIGQGTLRVVWKAARASTTYSDVRYLFAVQTSLLVNFTAYWDNTTTKWVFSDSATSISRSSGTDSFSAGDVIVFHFVWSSAGITMYVNGSELATSATYTLANITADILVGVDNATYSAQIGGTFLDFSSFGGALTATQIANDYVNVYAKATGGDGYGMRVSGIPYVWVKDGDAVVDNCDDSTYDNWGYVGGVPGTAPAKTRWTLTPNVGTGMVNGDVVWLGLHKDRLTIPTINSGDYYHDRNTNVDASSSGGGYDSLAVPVVAGTNYPYFQVTAARPWYLNGTFHVFARLKLASSTSTITATPYVGLRNGFVEGDDILLALTATWKAHYCGKVDIEQPNYLDWDDTVIKPGVVFPGSSASVTLYYDFMQVINGELLRISALTTRAPHDNQLTYVYAATTSVVIEDEQVYGDSVDVIPELRGDILEVMPDANNFFYVINNLASGHAIATTTKVEVGVTPRWYIG